MLQASAHPLAREKLRGQFVFGSRLVPVTYALSPTQLTSVLTPFLVSSLALPAAGGMRVVARLRYGMGEGSPAPLTREEGGDVRFCSFSIKITDCAHYSNMQSRRNHTQGPSDEEREEGGVPSLPLLCR